MRAGRPPLAAGAPRLTASVAGFPTVLWWIVRATIYATTFIVQPEMLSALFRGQPTLAHLIRLNKALSRLFGVFAVVSGFLALWPIALGSSFDQFNPVAGVGAVLFLSVTLVTTLALSAYQALYIEREINRALGQSAEISRDERTAKVRDKLRLYQRSVRTAMLTQVLLYTALAAIPFLWVRRDRRAPTSTRLTRARASTPSSSPCRGSRSRSCCGEWSSPCARSPRSRARSRTRPAPRSRARSRSRCSPRTAT